MKRLALSALIVLLLSGAGLANTYYVTNCKDSGTGSLRQAITNANSDAVGGSIIFNITSAEAGYSSGEAYSGLVTTEAGSNKWFRIILNSGLPTITCNDLYVMGSSQTWEASNTLGPSIEVRSYQTAYTNIFTINSANSVTIEGLTINKAGSNLFGSCIDIDNGQNCQVLGNYIGCTASGEAFAPQRSYYGVVLHGNAANNKIGNGTAQGRNVISGCNDSGVYLYSTAGNNEILGNYLGINAKGDKKLPNGASGVWIGANVQNTRVGNGTVGGRNVISGNASYGIQVNSSTTNNNYVRGNFIGVDKNGAVALLNQNIGIWITEGANTNFIGGATTGEGNVISGNNNYGIQIDNSGTECNSNEVLGNYIGTTASGEAALFEQSGIWLLGVKYNKIGNGTEGGRNIISGNETGIALSGLASNNSILGNYIGTNQSGGADVGNSSVGISIAGGSKSNLIGDGTTGGKNVISGNNSFGIAISESGTESNQVLGNYIGTTASGEAALPNTDRAVEIFSSAKFNLIGNGTEGGRNIISGNSKHGIEIISATSNEVRGNYIGITPGGSKLGNYWDGVYLTNNANYNQIGGTGTYDKNVISGNGALGNCEGIGISDSSYNQILGNYIGTNATGTAGIGNVTSQGMRIQGASNYNRIGNGAASGKNVISGNDFNGILIESNSNEVTGNYIGLTANGVGFISNSSNGISISSGAKYNKIGSATASLKNAISANSLNGIYLGSGCNSNEVVGNYIGTNASGTGPQGNGRNGITMEGCSYNKIGGTAAGAGNLISGNSWSGIWLTNSSTNEIYGNVIGLDSSGATALSNSYEGIDIIANSNNNKIGNGTASGRNVISKNLQVGIHINMSCSNEILGNYIGTNTNGTGDFGNFLSGIMIRSSGGVSSNFNKIGDGSAGGRNIICSNRQHGILLQESAYSNEIKGNYIGVESDGLTARGNWLNGIWFYGGDLYYNVVTSNIIANSGNADPSYHGILVLNSTVRYEKLSQNSIYNNAGKGIKLSNGGNNQVASPEITSTSHNQVTGLTQVAGLATAEANGTVEIFKAQGSQGKTYLGSANVGVSGNWNQVVTGLASGDTVVVTGTTASLETSEFSATKEVFVSLYKAYQPDLAIATLESGADYKTVGVFENTPVTQIKTRSVATNEAAIFYLGLLNSGNTWDTLSVSGEGSSGSFTVKYFSPKTSSTEVLPAYLLTCASQEGADARIEITYSGNTIQTKEVTVTATSTNDGTKIDAVKAIATFVPLPAPPTPTEHATQEFTETQLGVPGMHITIPSGACTVDVTVTASTVTAPSAPPAGYSVGGQTFNIGSTPVNTFSVPVTVTIPITGPLTFPKVYYWDGTKWSTEGIVIVSHTATSLTFTTTHFTIFAPMATLPGNLVRFGPNPYNPTSGSGRFWYVLNASADTTIYLIDLAGSVVFKQTYAAGTNGGLAGENNVLYNGNTSWGDQLGQGVYVYKIVQGGKAIGGGKIAVIK